MFAYHAQALGLIHKRLHIEYMHASTQEVEAKSLRQSSSNTELKVIVGYMRPHGMEEGREGGGGIDFL